ncbi:hypothetical protein C8F01DRAFT_1190191 [Mycena amicta]|nr:hypothetical protein C8F01DRAFT_1190191 [Mycena amicta]
MAAPSTLQTLRSFGIQIASDTAEYNQIREFANAHHLTDATTNPSLIFAAVSKPEYAHLVDDAVDYALRRLPAGSSKEVTALAMDRLVALVSAQIARIVPGRVSVSADPRLAYDTEAIITKAHSLVSLLVELGIPRQRVLVKIPTTYQGIRAAQLLERMPDEPIHTNMTLVFGRVQAEACAQAGVAVISPFIGRVKDFWDTKVVVSTEDSVAKHPGILLVRTIRASYTAQGVKTEILAAGFRAPEEVIELGAYGREGGPDAVTIPPSLIAPLLARQQREPRRTLKLSEPLDLSTSKYFGFGVDEAEGAAAYARDIAAEEIATVKVPEGLAKFSVDAQAMEDMLRRRIDAVLA